jgi:hypothetical protein
MPDLICFLFDHYNVNEVDLHTIEVSVWIAMSHRQMIGPMFFNKTINAQRHQRVLLESFMWN